MPPLSIKASDGWVIVSGGALAAATVLQVRDGEVLATTEAVVDDNTGFDLRALGDIRVASGKTLRVRTSTHAHLHYEALE